MKKLVGLGGSGSGEGRFGSGGMVDSSPKKLLDVLRTVEIGGSVGE